MRQMLPTLNRRPQLIPGLRESRSVQMHCKVLHLRETLDLKIGPLASSCISLSASFLSKVNKVRRPAQREFWT